MSRPSPHASQLWISPNSACPRPFAQDSAATDSVFWPFRSAPASAPSRPATRFFSRAISLSFLPYFLESLRFLKIRKKKKEPSTCPRCHAVSRAVRVTERDAICVVALCPQAAAPALARSRLVGRPRSQREWLPPEHRRLPSREGLQYRSRRHVHVGVIDRCLDAFDGKLNIQVEPFAVSAVLLVNVVEDFLVP